MCYNFKLRNVHTLCCLINLSNHFTFATTYLKKPYLSSTFSKKVSNNAPTLVPSDRNIGIENYALELCHFFFLKNTYVGCKFQVIDFLLLENQILQDQRKTWLFSRQMIEINIIWKAKSFNESQVQNRTKTSSFLLHNTQQVQLSQ